MYIYIYIYILVSAVPFLRDMRICDLEVLKDISHSFTTDVSFFRPYAETKNNGSDRKVCIAWLQFRSWLTPWGANYCFCLFIYLFIYLFFALITNCWFHYF